MQSVLFVEGVFVLFFAAMQLLAKDKLPTHYFMFFACVTLGYMLLYSWAAMSGAILRVPPLIGSDVPVVFFAAPSFYLAALSILREGRRPVRRYAVYFAAPFALSLGSLLYTVYAFLHSATPPDSVPSHFADPVATALTGLAVFSMSFAVGGSLFMAYRIYRSGPVRHKGEFFAQVLFLLCYFASVFVFWASIALRSDRLFYTGCLVTGSVAIVFVFTRTSVFYATQRYVIPIRPSFVRPEWDSAADDLGSRLAALMETASPYRDAELSVRKLAGLLKVDPRRLSYHLHANLSVSFRSYINEWRLKAVCRDLLADPHRSILEIAFEDGFNSKSSFNTLFVEKYGITPREFRKKASERRPASV